MKSSIYVFEFCYLLPGKVFFLDSLKQMYIRANLHYRSFRRKVQKVEKKVRRMRNRTDFKAKILLPGLLVFA